MPTVLDNYPCQEKLAARVPAWIRSDELSDAFAESAPSLDLGHASTEELKRLTKRRLASEIDFISNPEFCDPSLGRLLFAQPLGLSRHIDQQQKAGTARFKSGDLPVYLGRLCEAPLLTPEQERMLFQRMNYLRQQAAMHRGQLNDKRPSRVRLELIDQLLNLADWHRDRIVEANLRLVFSIVKKFVNPNCTFEELLSDGIVAIIRAVGKFDFGRGFRFSTYATQVVRRNSYQTVVLNQQERQTTLGGLQDMDFETTDVGRESAISEKRWHELRGRMSVMLDELDRREKLIIRARFALGSHRRVHTLQAIADRLGVSKERVRQLERRALDKLRDMASLADSESLNFAL